MTSLQSTTVSLAQPVSWVYEKFPRYQIQSGRSDINKMNGPFLLISFNFKVASIAYGLIIINGKYHRSICDEKTVHFHFDCPSSLHTVHFIFHPFYEGRKYLLWRKLVSLRISRVWNVFNFAPGYPSLSDRCLTTFSSFVTAFNLLNLNSFTSMTSNWIYILAF